MDQPDEVRRMPEISQLIKQTDANELLASSMDNQTLATSLRDVAAKDYPMGSMHFYILTEAANRLGSYS